MSDEYSQLIRITAGDKNTVERFINTLHKRSDRGRREFGVDIGVERVQEDSDHSTEFQ